jgi:AcrR family transcriptional regulator
MEMPASTKRPRAYRMGVRAAAAQETAARVLDVALELFTNRPYDDVSLAEVAERAGVTQRTVIRRFGTKEKVFFAANERAGLAEMKARTEVPVGDVAGAVAAIVASYERFGANRLRVLAQEDRLPIIAEDAEMGRQAHRKWVERTFAPLLDGLDDAGRDRRMAALITATDVYVWKLLRRDLGLSADDTRKVVMDLIAGLERSGNA